MKKLFYAILPLSLMAVSCNNNEAKTEDMPTHDDTIYFSTPHVVGKEINYSYDGVNMKGYLAYDENLKGKRPGVIVVHEWWGHNDYCRYRADKLAELRYVAFALDMYGDGKTADHPDNAGAFAGEVMKNFDVAKGRFNAAEDMLKSDEHCNTEEITAIGYCFGGGVVLNVARQGADLDGVATFHGSIEAITPATPGSLKGEVLVMNGADDPFVSQETIDAFKSEMDAAGVKYEFVNYPGAVHAFTNPAADSNGKKFNLPLAYNNEADEQSWEKLTEFLDRIFNKE